MYFCEYQDYWGFKSEYEIRNYRYNCRFLQKLGNINKHINYGLTIAELDKLASKCIQFRLSFDEFPSLLLIYKDICASLYVCNFSEINCININEREYNIELNNTLVAHIEIIRKVKICSKYV